MFRRKCRMNDSFAPGALAFRFRGGIWTLLFLVVLFLAEPAEGFFLPGLALVAAGQGIRFWAAGTITRYRGERVGAEKLVTWGPYRWARNPLYVGNGLIGAGWCLMSGSFSAFAVFAVVFVLLYVMLVIPYEESFLKRAFPEDFAEYSSRVGRFFPRVFPGAESLVGHFDPGVLWKSERHSLWVTIVGTLLIFSRRWW
jgi:protein-S-isoprenylcysteine O-methyltransferase Ste14